MLPLKPSIWGLPIYGKPHPWDVFFQGVRWHLVESDSHHSSDPTLRIEDSGLSRE
jgi:hypothetical protein